MILCFLYTLVFQSLLTTVKEIASTQAILLQENKEIRAQLNDMQEKQMQKLKHLKEKVIIPDQIRVILHLWMFFLGSILQDCVKLHMLFLRLENCICKKFTIQF